VDDYPDKHNYLKVNPPVRSPEDRNALWEDGIGLGLIDCVGSDHSPHTKEEKEKDYLSAPSGMPGVEEVTPLLLTKVNEGELDIEKFVELRSERPASILGLKDRGFIEEGNFADVIIVDMDKEWVIDPKNLHSKCGWSNYSGFKVKGAVMKTFVNGRIMFDRTF
jgi:dihydroorotase